jgi:hypothetical protein
MSGKLQIQMTVTNSAGGSGGMFGTVHGSGESCYLPASIVHASGAQVGDVSEVIVVENPNEECTDRTPYLVIYMDRITAKERAARKAAAFVNYYQATPAVEAAVWKYMLANRNASTADVVANTAATPRQVEDLMSRIGTPEHVWRGAKP